MKSLLFILLGAATLLSTMTLQQLEDAAEGGDQAAIVALRDSAKVGNSEAANFLGFLYWQGKGTKLDRDSALIYLREAAEAGNLKAAANLGHLLLTGENIKPDTLEAIKLLDKAATRGLPAAMYELDNLMSSERSLALETSALEAAEDNHTLEPSATLGHILAILGDARSRGRAIGYDHQKSIEYFYRAARLGNQPAQFILAELLEIFPDALSGLSDDPADSDKVRWYTLAYAAGITDAREAYRRLFQ